jgi:hypothetical protein
MVNIACIIAPTDFSAAADLPAARQVAFLASMDVMIVAVPHS